MSRCAGEDLPDIDPLRVATRTISGLYDGATTAELDRLSIQTAADLIAEEPQYSRLAARLLAAYIADEVTGQGIGSFSAGIAATHAEGLIGEATAAFVADHAAELDALVDPRADRRFEYFGLRTVADPLPAAPSLHPADPRDAAALAAAGGVRAGQRRGRGRRAVPADVLARLPAQLARVRSRGALIRGTDGRSNGIVPWLHTLDASVAAVNQGGRRKGAACVYLEPWHPDVEEFLELRDNTGAGKDRVTRCRRADRRLLLGVLQGLGKVAVSRR